MAFLLLFLQEVHHIKLRIDYSKFGESNAKEKDKKIPNLLSNITIEGHLDDNFFKKKHTEDHV